MLKNRVPQEIEDAIVALATKQPAFGQQRRSYEKPSERKNREKSQAIRRARKLARKKAQRDGLIPPDKKKLLDAKKVGQRPGYRPPRSS